jgi:hypothetical protein
MTGTDFGASLFFLTLGVLVPAALLTIDTVGRRQEVPQGPL